MRTRDTYEKFVYKHSKTIECIKKLPTFLKIYKFHGQITWEFLGLKMRNFQGIFIWIQTYTEILKSALAYLYQQRQDKVKQEWERQKNMEK